ncbi:MAG: hypothetical protein ACYCZR_02690 [Burkholderiales bacterium]
MSFEKPPLTQEFTTPTGGVPRAWAVWFTNIWVRLNETHGTTANRPTKGLFIGMQYYDTTLNKPVWLNSVRPSVWKDAAGTTV